MSPALRVAYAVGGGIPPATYEALRVYDDGAVRAVVGNAWPFGAPQDEAGSYEQRLEGEDATGLATALADPALTTAFASAGPPQADSGRCELSLGGGRDVVWSTTARPPEPLVPLVGWLRALLAATRRHPVGALALALEPPPAVAAGAAFELGLTLHNPGTEPVELGGHVDLGVRVLSTPADGEVSGSPDLEALVAGEPVDVPLPLALAAGERRTLAAGFTVATPGRRRLDVLARVWADLPYEGDTVRLECVLLAGPVVVDVGV